MTDRYPFEPRLVASEHRRSQTVRAEREAARRCLANLDAGYGEEVLETVARRMLVDLRALEPARMPVCDAPEPMVVQITSVTSGVLKVRDEPLVCR